MNETHYQISNGITGHRIELPSDGDAAALAQMLREHGLKLYELRPVGVTIATAPAPMPGKGRRNSTLAKVECRESSCRNPGLTKYLGYCDEHQGLIKRRGPRKKREIKPATPALYPEIGGKDGDA